MTKIESIHSWVEKNKIRKYSRICSKPRNLQQSNFSKGLTKLAILSGYKSPRMLCYLVAKCQNWTFKVNFLYQKTSEFF